MKSAADAEDRASRLDSRTPPKLAHRAGNRAFGWLLDIAKDPEQLAPP